MSFDVSLQTNVSETVRANFQQYSIQGFFLRIVHPIRQCQKTQMMAYDIQKRDAIDGFTELDMFDLAQYLVASLFPLHINNRPGRPLFLIQPLVGWGTWVPGTP